MRTPTRLLPLAGAYNFRDLGGYPTSEGRQTRWNILFRSDTLHEVTPDDLTVLRGLGLTTIVDLRTPAEVKRVGRGLLASEPILHINASVLHTGAGEEQAAPTPRGGDVAERYLSYLENGSPALVTALGVMAIKENYPLVFHCYAGKDRTGVLAALLLSCLGVQRRSIIDDYVITAARMDRIVERLRRDPVYGRRIAEVPPSAFAVVADTMARFLDGVDERHGGARSWALHAGVTPDQLDALADLLVG